MFRNGLHQLVDIKFIVRNMSNRTVKDDIKLAEKPDMIDVPCRIIRGEKIIFGETVLLRDGYEIRNQDDGVVYEVRGGGKRVRGIGKVHHSTYDIDLKKASAWNGWNAGTG